jgi:16S rRNA G1207 methylase RsmC
MPARAHTVYFFAHGCACKGASQPGSKQPNTPAAAAARTTLLLLAAVSASHAAVGSNTCQQQQAEVPLLLLAAMSSGSTASAHHTAAPHTRNRHHSTASHEAVLWAAAKKAPSSTPLAQVQELMLATHASLTLHTLPQGLGHTLLGLLGQGSNPNLAHSSGVEGSRGKP